MKHGLSRPPLEYGSGFPTLLRKEILRFYKVGFQTVAAPVLTAVLYLMIFGHVLEGREVYGRLSYTAFLIPGLVMMSVLQNAFANTSSSLIQSKVTGNLVFVLLAPLSHFEFYAAYILAAVFRGVVVGLGVLIITAWYGLPAIEYPLWILTFAFLGAAILGSLGLIAGIWADKYGTRPVALLGVTIYIIGLVFLRFADAAWMVTIQVASANLKKMRPMM